MFKVTSYPHGTFSWADSISKDAAAGKQFYAELMGWEIQDVPMGDGQFYTMFQKDGESVAGMGQMDEAMQAQGMPSLWQSYISVDDVDAVTERVSELGGTVMMGPVDVFDSGRMAVIQDPTGAAVGLWQPRDHKGAGLVNTPGAMAWNELATRDSERARSFYSDLFGWVFQKDEAQDYWFHLNRGRMNGGIMQMDESWGEMPPHWSVYFSVADLDSSVEKLKELDGSVMVPPTDAGEVGCFAVVSDPQGGAFTMIQLNEPEEWTE